MTSTSHTPQFDSDAGLDSGFDSASDTASDTDFAGPASVRAPRRRRLAIVASALVALTGAAVLTSAPASADTVRRPDIANAVLKLLNAQRRANHLAPLRMNSKLIASANAHNMSMAAANTMAHLVQNEAPFTQRIQAVNYRWRVAGENIGFNTDASVDGVLALENTMYAEVAPNNGHRLNILNKRYRDVGIDVVVDANGKVWLTEDFGRAR